MDKADFVEVLKKGVLEETGLQSKIIKVQKNNGLELWNVSQEDMTAHAEKNTELLLPAEITPLMDIVTKVLPMETGEAMPLFVSTNNRKLFGAGTILYHNLLSDFLKMQKSDYCILLPSSIHEMLLMPCESKPSKEEIRKLEKTVRTVNKEQVTREELLSDNVYLYDREQDKIKIA